MRAASHRVLFLNSSSELFGSERALLDLARSFEHRGHATKVVVPSEGPACEAFEANHLEVEVRPSIATIRREAGITGIVRGGLASVRPDASLRRTVDEFRPTVVYSNTTHVLAGPGLAARAGVPHVWHAREIERVPSRLRRAWGVVLLRTGQVVTISRAVAMSLFSPRIIRSRLDRSLHVVHDGVDLSILPYRAPRAGDDTARRVILVPGRLTPWKGQLFAVEATNLAARQLDLRIIGGATTQRDQNWVERQLAPAVDRSSNATLEPTRMAVAGVYQDGDFVLQASLAPEPFGRTVVEGMASGLVPIVPDIGGPIEVVRHEVDGFVYRAGDVRSLATTLEVAAGASSEELRTMSRSARKRVESCFTADYNADQILERVIGPHPGGRLVAPSRDEAIA